MSKTTMTKSEMRNHSVGIWAEMRDGQIAELVATNGETGDQKIEIWEIDGIQVANTNGDPIWRESADPADWNDLKQQCQFAKEETDVRND